LYLDKSDTRPTLACSSPILIPGKLRNI
jgi:hypothetical protein